MATQDLGKIGTQSGEVELRHTFVPRRGMRGAHLQTILSHFLPRRDLLAAPEARLFQVEEGAHVRCDCHWQPERATALTVIIVHGLEGSSSSQYVVGTANKAFAAGLNVVRMNVRNCGGTEHLTPTLYHSGMSADIGAVVRELIARDGLSRLVLAGFSMGGNQVLKLAGEWGREAPPQVRAVAAISPAVDLAASADALHLLPNRLYEYRFLISLMSAMRRKARLFPQRYDLRGVRFPRSIRDFDNQITSRYCGFTCSDDYYQRASAMPFVDRIMLPTLVIHAQDDPFVRLLPSSRAALLANPHVHLIETQHGGHCAFLADPDGYDGRWAEREIVSFFQQVTNAE